jgi:RNA polymerase sigma factor (sigma-70 family)
VTRDWRLLSDHQLWAQATGQFAGPAFGELFERHGDRVHRHCFHKTGSVATAEDLTSVVFLEAWRRRQDVRFSEDGSVLPWLLGVANYASMNAQRSLRRHRRLLAKLPAASAEPDIAEDAIHRIDTERLVAHLLCALKGLREPEREVLILCDWDGLSYGDAAVALDVPVGTVRSRLSRARQHLRDLIGAETAAVVAAGDDALVCEAGGDLP